jgi:hypothetical protein
LGGQHINPATPKPASNRRRYMDVHVEAKTHRSSLSC